MMRDRIVQELSKLQGAPCWHVSYGGATAPTFQIALGGKVPRSIPLKNTKQPKIYRINEGEMGLMIWCSWRLLKGTEVRASSSDGGYQLDELRHIVGLELNRLEVSPSWDASLYFDDASRIDIFCDRGPSSGTIEDNWELWTPTCELSVGPGLQVCLEEL